MILGKTIASLPLQFFFYLDGIYIWIYLFLELALFIYRGYTFVYSALTIGLEIMGVFLLVLVQSNRIFIGKQYLGSVGNKTEEIIPLLYMYLLSIPSIIGSIYFLRLQTYVYYVFRLVADVIVNAILIIFIVIEILLGLFALIKFKGAEKNQ